MKFKVKKPFIDAETQEQYAAEQIVEMTVARALTAAERLAAHGGGFLEVAEDVPNTIITETFSGDEKVDTVADYSEWRVADLKAELDRLEIEYPSDARKDDLIALMPNGEKGEE